VLILLLSFKSTPSALAAIKWSLISIAVSILPVFSVIIYLVRSQKLESAFINVRKQRTKIYLLAGVCAGIGYINLHCLGAPKELIATFVAGLSGVVVFMCVNLLWKISLHTAFVTASVTALIILYGSIATVTVVLVPSIAWARIELKHHSLAQVVTGALLATSIVMVVFYLFGLV
jgi:membrane-associated phospholipid phosphatase